MSINELAQIGLKAVEYRDAVEVRKNVAKAFGQACFDWKQEMGMGFIPKGSAEWELMMAGIPRFLHVAIDGAKRRERNARNRLFRAAAKAANDE